MSRSRKADPDAALNAALMLFWEHGFAGVGTRQIETDTGITRFTLQTTYGGKLTLYLKALDAYLDMFETRAAPNMTDGKLETLAKWFERRADPDHLSDFAGLGCMALNATVEFRMSQPQVTARIQRFYAIVSGGFERALTACVESGDLPPAFDCRAQAQLLMANAIGINMIIRAHADNTACAEVATATAALIRSWAH